MKPVFTCMPGGVIIDNSGLCCCVPYLMNAINSLYLQKARINTSVVVQFLKELLKNNS